MLKPNFSDPEAGRLWDAYFIRVDRTLRKAGGRAMDLSAELREHLMESFEGRQGDLTEMDRLQASIARLGVPESYLRPVLAEAMLERKEWSRDPVMAARGLYHALLRGFRYAVTASLFGLGSILLVLFAAMAVLKTVWSDYVGLVMDPDTGPSFGILRETMGREEVLGWWIIPISLLAVAVLYVMLTRTLHLLQSEA